MANGEQVWQLLQEVRELRVLTERQLELLAAILAMQTQIRDEIARPGLG